MTFVITGDVHHFKNRNELKAYIESQGGKVAGSVSGSTSFLINNDVTSTSGKNKKAQELIDALWKKSSQYIQWYCSLDGTRFASSQRECMINLYIMNQLLNLQDQVDAKKSEQMEKQLQKLSEIYYAKGGSFSE
jgi:hypothetical protein